MIQSQMISMVFDCSKTLPKIMSLLVKSTSPDVNFVKADMIHVISKSMKKSHQRYPSSLLNIPEMSDYGEAA